MLSATRWRALSSCLHNAIQNCDNVIFLYSVSYLHLFQLTYAQLLCTSWKKNQTVVDSNFNNLISSILYINMKKDLIQI
jgi:hypothetical protein